MAHTQKGEQHGVKEAGARKHESLMHGLDVDLLWLLPLFSASPQRDEWPFYTVDH